MRLITVRGPEGHGKEIADLAFAAGIGKVSLHRTQVHRPGLSPADCDVVDIEAPTPLAKTFIDTLLSAPFFDPENHIVSVREPRALITKEDPANETKPVVFSSLEVFEDLWQFSQVTASMIGRVFLAAALVAYGMIHGNIPVMLAGLLFLPYHHQMLSIAFGLCTREWQLLRQGLRALIVSTLLIGLAGAATAFFIDSPMEYDQFGSLLSGFAIALIIGIAAGLASIDDAGRRELIGLAATAHISILPAWFGISLVSGFPDTHTTIERCMAFAINVTTLILAAVAVYVCFKMQGEGLRRYARRTSGTD